MAGKTSAIPMKGRRGRGYSVRSPIQQIAPCPLPASCSPINHDLLNRTQQDAFTFEPELLKTFLMEESLWWQLPADLRHQLTFTQHAGATVLTALKRLELLQKQLPPEEIAEEQAPSPKAPSVGSPLEGPTALDIVTAKLADLDAINDSRPNRPKKKKDAKEYNCSPIADRPSFMVSNGSSRSPQSSNGTQSTGYMSPAARMSPPSIMSPVAGQDAFLPGHALSSFELPTAANMPTISRRDSEIVLNKMGASLVRRESDVLSSMTRSSTGTSSILKLHAPKDPKSTMFYAELEILRQKELVRLRHSQRPVNMLWRDLSREPALVPDGQIGQAFVEYWSGMKEKIASLDEHVKGLCEGIHFSVGWSDTPGLDHRYAEALEMREKELQALALLQESESMQEAKQEVQQS